MADADGGIDMSKNELTRKDDSSKLPKKISDETIENIAKAGIGAVTCAAALLGYIVGKKSRK